MKLIVEEFKANHFDLNFLPRLDIFITFFTKIESITEDEADMKSHRCLAESAVDEWPRKKLPLLSLSRDT